MPAAAEPRPDSPLKESVPYQVSIGWRELSGPATLTLRDGVYHLKAKVGFIGAGLFARTTPKLVQKAAHLSEPPPKERFVKGETSFENVPAVRQRLTELTTEIGTYYETPFFKLELEPVFLDEKKLLSDEDRLEKNYGIYQSRLFDAMARYVTTSPEAVPILVPAIPNQQIITPTIWDLDAPTVLLAHEVGHLLGTHTEGYELEDYPANGLMNDELVFRELAKEGLKPVFLRSDFNEIMRALLERAKPKIAKGKIMKAFSPTSEIYANDSAENYWQLTQEGRLEWAREKVRRFKLSSDCGPSWQKVGSEKG